MGRFVRLAGRLGRLSGLVAGVRGWLCVPVRAGLAGAVRGWRGSGGGCGAVGSWAVVAVGGAVPWFAVSRCAVGAAVVASSSVGCVVRAGGSAVGVSVVGRGRGRALARSRPRSFFGTSKKSTNGRHRRANKTKTREFRNAAAGTLRAAKARSAAAESLPAGSEGSSAAAGPWANFAACPG